jgi:hypothetical protein
MIKNRKKFNFNILNSKTTSNTSYTSNEIINSVTETDSSVAISSNLDDNKLGTLVSAINIISKVCITVGEAISPYSELISKATCLISGIYEAYEKAQNNTKLCNILMRRIDILDIGLKSLRRQGNENIEGFKKQEYYNAFVRFVEILVVTQEFIKKVTDLRWPGKLIKANDIDKKFNEICQELDRARDDLNFTIILNNYEQDKKDRVTLQFELKKLNKVKNSFLYYEFLNLIK